MVVASEMPSFIDSQAEMGLPVQQVRARDSLLATIDVTCNRSYRLQQTMNTLISCSLSSRMRVSAARANNCCSHCHVMQPIEKGRLSVSAIPTTKALLVPSISFSMYVMVLSLLPQRYFISASRCSRVRRN